MTQLADRAVTDQAPAAMIAGAIPLSMSPAISAATPRPAARLGVPCRWNRVVVPGVAHEGMRMSEFAGDYWFGGKS